MMEPSRTSWAQLSIDEVRRILAVDLHSGLSSEEVKRRFELYGPNELRRAKQDGILTIVVRQFKNPLVLVLCVASVVTALLGEHVDSIVILLALCINVVVGTFQEERAGKAFEKLNASQEHRVVVIRNGERENISARELVPGDVLLMEGGYFVPADMRLLEEKDLRVNEAALTGEWLAVAKDAAPLKGAMPLAERANMAWMGTLIEAGYGKGVVVETGTRTQLGLIANELASIEEQVTPLQRNIRSIAHFISYAIAGALILIFIAGVMQGMEVREMLFIGIAVAVASVPTGLPAALTIVLAIGMETILKRGGLVRNLLAAETLGSTTMILTDKTGTLTEARMKLAGLYSFQGVRDALTVPTGDNRFLLEMAVLASDAFIEEKEDAPNKLTVHGRPIEKAVALCGLETGLVQSILLAENPCIDRLQFTSARRFGASLHKHPNKKTNRLIITGEPETLIAAATTVRVAGKRQKVTEDEKRIFQETMEQLAREGKRVIGVAYRDAVFETIPEDGSEVSELPKSLVFAGLIAFEDPIRRDVRAAVVEVREAGAQVIMLTGDNPETARYIAREVGIIEAGDELVIRGSEIDAWDDRELYTKLRLARVIARALPAHKLRVVRLLKAQGEVVAMTGDGINDAPALRAANIGIAVGSGTEVAKEASDMVLIDDSFSVIVSAIEEGRRIIDNLKRIIAFLLSTSFSEIILIAGALMGGAAIPLTPVQILWANIVGGDLVSFAYAFEKKDPTAMRRDPRSARAKNIITQKLVSMIVILSIVSGATAVFLYYWLLGLGVSIEEIRTVMFVTLSLDSIFFSFSLKAFDTPVWRVDIFDNRYLLGTLSFSLALLLLALFFGPMQALLSLVPLASWEIGLLLGVGLFNLATIELVKWLYFQRTSLVRA
ncbi:MAG: HAD-IC family P-type ATPase [Candidatus Pacebacteria bacterium]|nr:HAD-IC family P-type ATPase [Candidatus Paceibacterota bacterium]